ncbi:carbohydrate ABC transporter permease [Paenibacillus koleovorans]|uniref:carbohydrate ABC transporter permease n=1 Tax=Paenibacillus koleovorans TaxID=121608 RepID=UPI000FDB2134|nr:carbohydrate ABC transporter permease [Paenibacillus koleovorans]
MRIKTSAGEKAFDTFNVLLLLALCATILIPFLFVLASSLSSTTALIQGRVRLWPVEFNLDNYAMVMTNAVFWRSFGISVLVVTIGTLLNMFMTVVTAYPLSRPKLKGKKAVLLGIVFTMIFQAPIVPTYILVKQLGLLNSIWALIIPAALSAFNLLICLTSFRSLPEELLEAARVDGMNEYRILYRIVVPLSIPILVTLILFYAVGHWNNYFAPLLYITKSSIRPLQLYLYNIIAQFNMSDTFPEALDAAQKVSPQGLQMTVIIVSSLPILLIYPFIQKHFIKGALLGSIKE